MTRLKSSSLSVEEVQEIMRRELSMPKRIGYLLLLMVTLLAAGLLGTLWLTEPGPLPMRTQVAFAALVAINLAWSGLCGWIVTRRQVLFAFHRVVAGWMAIAFCGAFLLIGLSISLWKMSVAATVAVGIVGSAQLLIAVLILRRARSRRRLLLSRRDELAAILDHRSARS